MAFPMSETDYKPWASLGAVYQGENAADAQDMRQQELLKAAFENETNPLKLQMDLDQKRAQAEWYRAQSEKASRDDSERYADKIQKAEADKRLQKNRDIRGLLETAYSMQDIPDADSTSYLDNLISSGKISPEIAQRLRPAPNVNLYTKDNLRRIIDGINSEDPSASRVLMKSMGEEGATDRKRMEVESKERIAQWQTTSKKELADLKAKSDKASLNQRAAQYLDLYNKATEPSEKLAYFEMYQEAKEAAAQVAAASATQGPGAKAAADELKLLRMLKNMNNGKLNAEQEKRLNELERTSSGAIGGGTTKKPELTSQQKRDQL